MATSLINNSLRITGDLILGGTLKPDLPRSNIKQTALASYLLPWEGWRVWDAYGTNLPATPLTDDLGLVSGAFSVGSPSIQTEDLKTAGATSSYARITIQLPPEYDDTETVTIRLHAGMLTTTADSTATADIEMYASDEEAGKSPSSDLITTAAQSINSTTLADYDFSVNASSLAAGSILDIRLHLAISDAAAVTVVKGLVGAAYLLCDIR